MRGRRIAVDVGTGMAAVFIASAARSIVRRRRPNRTRVRWWRRRRDRKAARVQAIAAARWVQENVDATRLFQETSAHASAHLADRDNARRAAVAYDEMSSVARESMDAAARSGAGDRHRDALRQKVDDLETESDSHRTRVAAAEAELATLQRDLSSQLADLLSAAPVEITVIAADLVGTHDDARGDVHAVGAVDEARARRRLERLIALRDGLDQTLTRLSRSDAA